MNITKEGYTYNATCYIEETASKFVKGEITQDEMESEVKKIIKEVLIPDLLWSKKRLS